MLPTILTLLRVFAIPVLLVVFYLPFPQAHFWAFVIFTLAMATDWLDGYLARKLRMESRFGAFLDPVADKLLVAITIILVVSDNPSIYVVLPATVIIGREIVVLALREWMAEIGQQKLIAVSVMAKYKTAFQGVALALMLYKYPIAQWDVYQTGIVLLYVATVLTLASMLAYLKLIYKNIA